MAVEQILKERGHKWEKCSKQRIQQVQRPGGRCELPWFKEPQEDSMAKARGREVLCQSVGPCKPL